MAYGRVINEQGIESAMTHIPVSRKAIESAPGAAPIRTAPVFARHETFHPRYGWLKKGFDAARRDPLVFGREEAAVALGVGKNMVRAIRYWCLAFKILEEISERSTRRVELHPTEFGRMVLADTSGLDPYTEYTATLWLLHWKLLAEPCLATAWQLTFNSIHRQEFVADELAADLKKLSEQVFPDIRLADSAFQKDASCLLRMYAESGSTAGPIEESIDCPFVELGLIKTGTNRRYFRFNVGAKALLPNVIVGFSCLEFADMHYVGAQTISLASLLNRPGSPGLIFKLTEQSLYAALEDCFRKNPDVGLRDTAGVMQLFFNGKPGMIAQKILHDYYQGIQ